VITTTVHVSVKRNAFGNGDWKASVSPKKFMPKNPARNDIGRNITVTRVNVFMMSLVRFEIADRYVSIALAAPISFDRCRAACLRL